MLANQHFVGNASLHRKCARSSPSAARCQAFPPAASMHYPPTTGYEMVAPKLRSDKLNQQWRQQHFQATSSAEQVTSGSKLHCFYDTSVEIRFDRFWVDFGEGLREDVLPEGSQEGSGYLATTIDQVVGSIGRAAFFPQFAVFPIHYLDDDMTVFEFTPLSSKISAQRVGSF
ncbi:hypothetical protein DUNSADRAFT_5172 [Dunaliella salina]|uniref:Uncharacterized protein n=1 Tax=Dunaliella salina TaxID=3046 RepID=A0ABQ7H7G6_DUNSA|nr:hypothetical protein DUNSADRAFT_5172 [Dunaliella salina]|eukprot:KAF5842800.1 hypothetical protein DUNSADRAFT_5172 [Dunaliella salina]